MVKRGLLQEEFEDTNGVIRISKSKKNRQHNGQKKRDKQRSTKHTQYKYNKDRVTRTPLKTGVNSGAAEGLVEITIMDTIGQMLQNKSTKRS